jgi:hypothetical protein
MPKVVLYCIFLLYFGTNAWGQACDCSENLSFLIQKVTKNYAGFADKVTPITQNRYTQLVDSLRQAAKENPSENHCFVLLKKYKNFFRDGHLQINYRAPITQTATAANVPTFSLEETEVKKYYQRYKDVLNNIEGIWEDADHQYRMAIIKNITPEREFIGVILQSNNPRWKAGMIKLEIKSHQNDVYEGKYYRRDFLTEQVTIRNSKNIMDILGFGFWLKIEPQPLITLKLENYLRQKMTATLDFKVLNNNFTLLRIRSFDLSVKSMLDSLISSNYQSIVKIPNMIIDIRDNAGGADDTFRSLLKLLYTNPIKSAGTGYLATDENIQRDEEILAHYRAQLSPNMIKDFEELLQKGKNNIGTMVKTPPDSLVFSNVLPYPKRIAIITNKRCFSSAEQFRYIAKQSKKVTIFGENTGGVMDYGDVRAYKMPYPRFSLGIATTRSGWVDYAPIDNVGFAPDIYIPETENDWIAYIQDFWGYR